MEIADSRSVLFIRIGALLEEEKTLAPGAVKEYSSKRKRLSRE